jgi:hypothetical protein
MAGFAVAALIAMFCLLAVTAEDWWPIGRRILSMLFVFLALAAAVGGINLAWPG